MRVRVARANITTPTLLAILGKMNISGEFWGRVDTWAGPTFGVILLCVGIYLMFKGASQIKALSFLTGCAIGQLSSALLYGSLSDFISLSEFSRVLYLITEVAIATFIYLLLIRLIYGKNLKKIFE